MNEETRYQKAIDTIAYWRHEAIYSKVLDPIKSGKLTALVISSVDGMMLTSGKSRAVIDSDIQEAYSSIYGKC